MKTKTALIVLFSVLLSACVSRPSVVETYTVSCGMCNQPVGMHPSEEAATPVAVEKPEPCTMPVEQVAKCAEAARRWEEWTQAQARENRVVSEPGYGSTVVYPQTVYVIDGSAWGQPYQIDGSPRPYQGSVAQRWADKPSRAERHRLERACAPAYVPPAPTRYVSPNTPGYTPNTVIPPGAPRVVTGVGITPTRPDGTKIVTER